MIAKISAGKSTAGLIRYLYDTQKARDHTDPHLVASWDGFAPDPGRADDPATARKLLVADLDLHLKQARRLGRAPERHVWHCSVRAAPEDRTLTDEEWATVARRVVHTTGIAPEGDPDGCRWVAVRHASDHIHIAATAVRGDLRMARHWNDYLTADRELVRVEEDYGLRQVARGDRTAAKRATRAEQEKARRTGHDHTARERLRTNVRTAVAAAASPEEFVQVLASTGSVLVDVQRFPSGDIRGYKVALAEDRNAAGEPVWFSGSKLAPDLSFPKIRSRLAATEADLAQPTPRRPDPWHQATAAIEDIPTCLSRDDEAVAQAHIAALGEALNAVPLRAPDTVRAELQQAASVFERATRSRVRAEHHHARALRGAVKTMLRQPPPDEGATLAMFLDAAVLAVIAVGRWHQLRRHQQQAASAQQALHHLRAAYDRAAAEPLTALAQHTPTQATAARYAGHVRQAVPTHADQILQAPEWSALAAAIANAEKAGHQPQRLLQQASDQRALDDARSPARVLTWRVERLGHRTPPSRTALAARTRSTHGVPISEQPSKAPPPARRQPSAPAPAPRRRR